MLPIPEPPMPPKDFNLRRQIETFNKCTKFQQKMDRSERKIRRTIRWWKFLGIKQSTIDRFKMELGNCYGFPEWQMSFTLLAEMQNTGRALADCTNKPDLSRLNKMLRYYNSQFINTQKA